MGGSHLEKEFFQGLCWGWQGSRDLGAGRAGLNSCSGFKAFHRPTNRALDSQFIFSCAVLAVMRSNHIGFQVTFTKLFTALRDSILAFRAPSVSWVFPVGQYIPVPGICQLLPYLHRLPNIMNFLSHNWAQHRCHILYTGDEGRLEDPGFHSFSEFGPISPSNLGAALFCGHPGSHMPKESPPPQHWDKPSCRLE